MLPTWHFWNTCAPRLSYWSRWLPIGGCSIACPPTIGGGSIEPSRDCRHQTRRRAGTERKRTSVTAKRPPPAREEAVLDRTGNSNAAPAAGDHDTELFPAHGRRGRRRRRQRSGGRPFEGSAAWRVGRVRRCYICKQAYSVVHHFYDQLCPACGDVNFTARTELADLRGRVALLTGGRVKIGYQAGLKLLRSGAHLIVTTRFPRDAAARYAQEPDFGEWAGSSRDRSASICARRRASKRSAASSSRRAAGWTSSSTMRARPCAAPRISMRT